MEHWRNDKKLAVLVEQDDFRYDTPKKYMYDIGS